MSDRHYFRFDAERSYPGQLYAVYRCARCRTLRTCRENGKRGGRVTYYRAQETPTAQWATSKPACVQVPA
jgi:hypothetical protein